MNSSIDKYSILIIEDYGIQAKLWKEYLNDNVHSLDIDISVEPATALKYVKDKKYDLIILDIMMRPLPEWNQDDVAGGFWSGKKIFLEIEKICKSLGQKVPIILIVTAIKDARKVLYNGAYNFFKENCQDWLDKPIDPKDLENAIVKALKIK
jgi:CheY-like chemotaxis protein